MTAAWSRHASLAPPPTSGVPGVTVRAPRVLVVNQQGAAALARGADPLPSFGSISAGTYARVPASAVVVYRIEAGPHRQTGVLVEVSVDDYRHGRIRRHEDTQPERERRLAEATEAAGVQRMPVTLLHPQRDRLRALLAELSAAEPDVRVTSPEGVTHTVWVCPDPAAAQTVQDEIAGVGALYIADGHHRMAATHRQADDGHGAGAFTAAALFPSDEMRILGYHRCVPLPSTASVQGVLDALGATAAITRIEECPSAEAAPPAPGVVAIRLHGRCYRLWLRAPSPSDDVRAALDVVKVDEELLPALRDVTGGHSRTTGVPERGERSGQCWCDSRAAVRLLPHPPTIEQVMAVADAGMTMPPKSTWFDPKASDRLFLRQLV